MFELPSAIFLIADGNEFRFVRFYIVCEEVPLGTPESPLIVCGLSDTLRECPNVAKTRNGMPAAVWKKYSNFASKIYRRLLHFGTRHLQARYDKLCCPQPAVTEYCIGHTHIDVAWKWPLRQTVEKAVRSFYTVLELMDQYSEYRFMSSQPQLYVSVKEEDPDL